MSLISIYDPNETSKLSRRDVTLDYTHLRQKNFQEQQPVFRFSMRLFLVTSFMVLFFTSFSWGDDDEVATLYREDVTRPHVHYPIATFDAPHKTEDGRFAFNWNNCQIARDLFANQPLVTVKYLCEKGRHK